jgi:hypothetical protein
MDNMILNSALTMFEKSLSYVTYCAELDCKIEMHCGHHDVFDKIFHISIGNINKALCVIYPSEDILLLILF